MADNNVDVKWSDGFELVLSFVFILFFVFHFWFEKKKYRKSELTKNSEKKQLKTVLEKDRTIELVMDSSFCQQPDKELSGQPDRLKLLYPNVDENLTPLPRSWSSQEKCTSIGLTQNNLRVHYKGFYSYLFLCKFDLIII